jgi:asparagine synthase (glutamine-hydrolysing)
MCGICGSASTLGRFPKNLDDAVQLLAYRGPDDEGVFLDNQISLGHTRLAIQDSANAQQPMVSNSGNHIIVFNGEIYNHFELRKLVPDHSWKTRSDTETVLELFEYLGETVFSEFVGMYAFGIWNIETKKLTLARDINGEKPLFYLYNKKEFVFSSEARVVASLVGISESLESKTFPHFLKYGYFNPKESFIDRVAPVIPGNVVSWNNGEVVIKPNIKNLKPIKNSTNTLASIGEMIETAVQRTLLADEEVGVMLSGGIDSSIIAALASKFCPGLPTFTFALTKNSQDARFAKLVADKIKSDHYEITIDPREIAEEIERVITSLPQPLADSAVIPTNLLSQFAKSKVKVLLSGDGADEVFAGYGYYDKYRNLEPTSKIESFARQGLFNLLKKSRYKKITRLRDEFKKSKLTSGRSSYQESWNEDLAAFTDSELGRMLGVQNFKENKGELEFCGSEPNFWDVLRADREYYLTGDILQKSDLGGMLASVEIRAPYLDLNLNRYLMENIADPKLLSKNILNESFPGLIPDAVYKRKKQGFGAPLDEWFAIESVVNLVNSTLKNQRALIYKHFDFEETERYINTSNLKKWNFFVLALWLDKNDNT